MSRESIIHSVDLPFEQVSMRDFVLDDVLGFEMLPADLLRSAKDNPGYLFKGVTEAREALGAVEHPAVEERLELLGKIAHRFARTDNVKNDTVTYISSGAMLNTRPGRHKRSGSYSAQMGDSGFAY